MRRLASRRGCTELNFNIPSPPTWDGNLNDILSFILSVVFWLGTAFLSFLVDVFGALFLSLACLVYSVILAPVNFLLVIIQQSTGSFRQFGPLAPIVGALVFSGVIVILIFAILMVYRMVVEQSEQDISGKDEGPGASEAGEIGGEL